MGETMFLALDLGREVIEINKTFIPAVTSDMVAVDGIGSVTEATGEVRQSAGADFTRNVEIPTIIGANPITGEKTAAVAMEMTTIGLREGVITRVPTVDVV